MFLGYPIPKSLSSGKGLGRFALIYMWFIVLSVDPHVGLRPP